MTFVIVSELPNIVQSALKSLNYNKNDIEVKAAEEISLLIAGGSGYKGFVTLLDLNTNATQTIWGSWGGANMFNQSNPVDLDDRNHKLPVNGMAIKGSSGEKVFATLYVHPENMPKYLAPVSDLTERDREIMYAFGALKSGVYRQQHLGRMNATESEIDSLINRGYLKKDGRGIQITIKGKNSRVSGVGSSKW